MSGNTRFSCGEKARTAVAALLLALLGACSGSATPGTSTRPSPTPTTATSGEVVVSPEFIQGAIPGAKVILLVSQDEETAGAATVTATSTGAEVTVQPSRISGTDVAEVTLIPEDTTTETQLEISIEIATGDGTQTVTRTVTIIPWEDDRADQAADILGLFTVWLAENQPELNVSAETEFEGTFLAPQLLVVSHYEFLNDDWELGLSWHVMIPPDDFSELYLRPRTELRPTLAFRIDSWQTALETGDYQVRRIDPPLEVIR